MTTEEQETKEEEAARSTPLFRKEALQAKKGSYFGKTLIVTPISFCVWTFSISTIALIIGLYLYFGEYAKRQIVPGVLVPDKGLLTVYAKNYGVVLKSFVRQGEQVQKGQLLYLISTEQEALSEQSVAAQQIELLKKQIAAQKDKIAMFEKSAAGFAKLRQQHFISEIEYQRRQDEYLTAQLALHNYERELAQVQGGINYAVRAPVDGTISVLIAMAGDHVAVETPLLLIVPKDSHLEGQLFIPTSKAGFVKVGQRVLLRYHAYPYQRFGLYEATVSKVDKSVIKPQDLKAILIPGELKEVFYRVVVTLASQHVTVYGKPYPLTAGMLFDGVVLGEKRRIWQWILDPIYSLRGAL